MSERLNIWGEQGCKLPNGDLCHACCDLYKIPEIMKGSNTLCDFVDIEGDGGCKIHEFSPNRCQMFYCDNVPNNQKLALIDITLKEGLINLNDAQKAVERALNS